MKVAAGCLQCPPCTRPSPCHTFTQQLNVVVECLQTQSSNTELTRSIELLQEELKAAKSVSAQLQSLVAEQQQRWHDQSRSVQAEHEKQVCGTLMYM